MMNKPTEDDLIATSRRVRKLTHDDGRSLSVQSGLMGIDRKTLWYITSGQVMPSAVTLKAMARFYGVSADYLLGLV